MTDTHARLTSMAAGAVTRAAKGVGLRTVADLFPEISYEEAAAVLDLIRAARVRVDWDPETVGRCLRCGQHPEPAAVG